MAEENIVKTKLLIGILSLTLLLAGCGTSDQTESTATSANATTESTEKSIEQVGSEMADEALSDITTEVNDAANNIDSDKHLLSIEVTLPASVDDITDEEIEDLRTEEGYISITRNDDDSITYVMTKNKQKELLDKLENRFADFADSIPGSEDYPNVTKLEVNSDFSKFTITTTAQSKDEISLSETMLAAVFYSFGGAYRGYACESDTSVTVDYVCDSTGEIIASGNSANVE